MNKKKTSKSVNYISKCYMKNKNSKSQFFKCKTPSGKKTFIQKCNWNSKFIRKLIFEKFLKKIWKFLKEKQKLKNMNFLVIEIFEDNYNLFFLSRIFFFIRFPKASIEKKDKFIYHYKYEIEDDFSQVKIFNCFKLSPKILKCDFLFCR